MDDFNEKISDFLAVFLTKTVALSTMEAEYAALASVV